MFIRWVTPLTAARRRGPESAFHTTFPSPGSYRLFLDFQHHDVVRTAAFTVNVSEAAADTGHRAVAKPSITTDMSVVELSLDGMTCASCATRIEKKLNKIDGVTATVNFATEKARVAFDDDVTADQLRGDGGGRRLSRSSAVVGARCGGG